MSDAVINFMKKRSEAIEQRRREFERIMFKNYLGCYCIFEDGAGHYSIDLIDISDNGCLLQIPIEMGLDRKIQSKLSPGEDLRLRLYFTHKTYLPINMKIKHLQEHTDEETHMVFQRIGCEFDKMAHSFEALRSFISFIYKFAEHSCIDKGDG